MHRRVKNQRPAAAGYIWASPPSPPRPAPGSTTISAKPQATRTPPPSATFSRLLGCLHHFLQTWQHYNEDIAFPPTHHTRAKAA
jgi:hypothetical protein